MNSSAKAFPLILIAGAWWGWSPSSPQLGAQPSSTEIAGIFTNYQRITKSEVYVNPNLAELCRGASIAEVERARLKFGPHANTGILIYMNELASKAFATNSNVFPVGAVIVKQKT